MKTLKRGIAQTTDAISGLTIVGAILVVLLIPLSLWAAEVYRMNVAAGQANTVQKAVNRYIADQQATIAAGSSPSSAYTLTVPMLVTAGYLPSGYSSSNTYTATYRTLIFQPTANKFHTMTFLTGGTALTLSQARKLASYIGAAGGYIQSGVAKGALGSWQENLSAFGGYNPGDGSVVIAGFYSNGALVNDYLYRHSVAGHPELNTMGTTLNMGGNNITSANNVGANNGNFSQTVNGQTLNASGDVNTARLTAQQSVQSNGWITANGNITSNSSIAAAGNITAGSNITANGNLTANNDVIANGTLRGNNDLVLGGVMKLGQINTAGTYCDTWGAISRDASGAILSCQYGVWKSAGTNKTIVRTGSAKTVASVSCANNETLLGGGGSCDTGSDNRLKWSAPSGNGWSAACPDVTTYAYAICAQN
ncbi:shufflon system plasmid conjugative transfer pilus tip adhesin PilV [Rahnella sp. ChDrAdgB13]|uniref:shufflon system plasmid conjugative transfer pilus tip adhesin PilV n=1 Tax=Rahnella sp. ChDrAdgB13 TaxID=1850581 RepID=UPI001FCBB3EA|nr:shufflon system plasmid conjugative transfer pilus tip adhesin PilV [Rahnella sp. ChDrAdgB13]